MADELEVEDRLWVLQKRLKEERLFIAEEKNAINGLKDDILSTSEKLFHLSWITRQQWRNLQRLRLRVSPAECSHAATLLDSAKFVDGYRYLGIHESVYGEFLKDLRENPRLVASTLAYADRIGMDTRQIIRLLMNSLYGNALLPHDEQSILIMMKTLIELEIVSSHDPKLFFRSYRKSNSFTNLFLTLTETLFSAKLYLTAALHHKIMQVLVADDEKALVDGKLPRVCAQFVHSLEEKMYCFPSNLRWIFCQLYNLLLDSGKVNEKESRGMVAELIFDVLICPAILNPEAFGINSDLQISDVARSNLQQISTCLQQRCLAMCSVEQRRNTNEVPKTLFESSHSDLLAHCISTFMKCILEDAEHVKDIPAQQSLKGLARSAVLITENELKALVCFLRMIQVGDNHRDIVDDEELFALLKPLPPPPPPPRPDEVDTSTNPVEPPLHLVESPKPPRQKFKINFPKKRQSKHHQDADSEPETPERPPRASKSQRAERRSSSTSINAFQSFQDECNSRLTTMFKDEIDVMVVSLGCVAIECPGLASEQEVLRLKPHKTSSMPKNPRPRTNSHFSQVIASVSVDKVNVSDESNSPSQDSDSDSTPNQKGDTDSSQSVSAGAEVGTRSQSSADYKQSPEDEISRTEVESGNKLDLVDVTLPSTNMSPSIAPDVVKRRQLAPSEEQSNAGPDLIDLGEATESVTPQGAVSMHSSGQHLGHLLDMPIESMMAGQIHSPGTRNSGSAQSQRDSTFSSGSSARESTVSTVSSMSSGTDYGLQDSGIGGESDDHRLRSNTRPGNARDSLFSNTSTNRDSIMSSGSVSSATVTSLDFSRQRASEGSIGSDDFLEIPHENFNSNAEDESEQRPSKNKAHRLASKRDSMKRAIKRLSSNTEEKDHHKKKGKKKGKKREKGEGADDDGSKNKDKWYKGLKSKGSVVNRTKVVGRRAYMELEEGTRDMLDISKALPANAVPEKTPKDISEEIMEKYRTVARQKDEEQSGEAADDYDDEEEEDDVFDEVSKFDDAKRKLRMVLCRADFQSLPWLKTSGRKPGRRRSFRARSVAMELMTFLHVQLAEAINLQDRSLAAQLHETIRSVKHLAEGSSERLLESLEDDYKKRAPYIRYLTESRQSLLTIQAQLERMMERVERDKMICNRFFTYTCVKLFLESRKKEINSFASQFKASVLPEEKMVDDFLIVLYEAIRTDPIWLGSSEEQLQDAETAIERAIMSEIFKRAFYPKGDVDVQMDNLFHENLQKLKEKVNLSHKALRIDKTYRKEAPWPSAQQELWTINAYKTPKDKMKCIQRCCSIVMNLLSMASDSSVPCADEFVPALIIVVLQANPPSLLSTVEYINMFYGRNLSGEESFCWMQFCAAIAYIKNLCATLL